jgi:uncharacterized protein (DUF433 family)
MENVVTCNPRVLGGTPCFSGTRVPVTSLFDYLEGGYNVEYFLEQFPSVKRPQVATVLENARRHAEQEAAQASPELSIQDHNRSHLPCWGSHCVSW